MPPLLDGVAFISGAAMGIGKATAFAFARHGVRRLALADINRDAQQKTTEEIKKQHSNVDIINLEMDTGNEADIVRGHEQLVNKWGRIDYAVNNAGIGFAKEITEWSGDEITRMLKINLFGVLVAQREQIKYMLKQEPISSEGTRDRGVIMNTASMLGLVASSPAIPATPYNAAKHGVVGITKSDAVIYAGRGIRINAVCPGYIETPMMKLSGAAMEVMKNELKKVPAARMGQPEEIANAFVFLASPMSSFMHGHAMVVDGGFTL